MLPKTIHAPYPPSPQFTWIFEGYTASCRQAFGYSRITKDIHNYLIRQATPFGKVFGGASGYDTIAAAVRCTDRTAIRAIQTLETCGLLARVYIKNRRYLSLNTASAPDPLQIEQKPAFQRVDSQSSDSERIRGRRADIAILDDCE